MARGDPVSRAPTIQRAGLENYVIEGERQLRLLVCKNCKGDKRGVNIGSCRAVNYNKRKQMSNVYEHDEHNEIHAEE